ncbi:hypothetical protein QWE_05863 [Agrobacterium albertimagni AOL15]|uniref:Uncharacterized protein n=2 Tax=Agrobacterium albertimagni TaxID=147266 RepID=K2PI68_9HYPH|nr:hypothetical protein QWE_05863 [Agrobacterium albertimagni AOL15]
MERAKHLLQTEGVIAAVEALVAVCRDPKAPAPAKSTAGTSILRAGGFFDQKNAEPDKDLSQMSMQELRDFTNRIETEKQAALKALDGGNQDDVFG